MFLLGCALSHRVCCTCPGSKYRSKVLFAIFITNYFLLYKSLERFLILRVKTVLKLKEKVRQQLISAGL